MASWISKLLFCLPPELAHETAKAVSGFVPVPLLRALTRFEHPCLKAKIGKTPLANPVGLAAGFDKNGEMTAPLAALGFGFLELGSVTAVPCPGLPGPRILRLKSDGSLLNAMGLPNVGSERFAAALEKRAVAVPYGVNIAKTPDFVFENRREKPPLAVDDFLQTYAALHKLGAYTVFNLSCPNTGESRTFEDPALFRELGAAITEANEKLRDTKPVYIKISPDLEPADLKKTVELACRFGFDGFVVGNTSRKRPRLKSRVPSAWKSKGGLSGAALTEAANAQLGRVAEIVQGKRTLIAAGGIMGFGDLLEKLTLGADLCQIYTGLVYNGPFFVNELNRKLAEFCERHGLKSYRDAAGFRTGGKKR